jgi:hypothetical protein
MIRTLALCACFLLAPGCGSLALLTGGTGGEFVSDERPAKLSPRFTTRVFSAEDRNTADIILSDLDPQILTDRSAMKRATGQILHTRMFVKPYAGRTPIEPTACSVTMRYIVLAGGEFGIYAGGGFLLPDGAPEGRRFSGKISGASLRLVSASPGFNDLIGSGSMSLSFRVRRDEDLTRAARRHADFLAFAALPTPHHPLLVEDN